VPVHLLRIAIERLSRPTRFLPDLPNTRQILIRQRNRNARLEPCDTGIAVFSSSSPLLGKRYGKMMPGESLTNRKSRGIAPITICRRSGGRTEWNRRMA
jgi:hypothetical protein